MFAVVDRGKLVIKNIINVCIGFPWERKMKLQYEWMTHSKIHCFLPAMPSLFRAVAQIWAILESCISYEMSHCGNPKWCSTPNHWSEKDLVSYMCRWHLFNKTHFGLEGQKTNSCKFGFNWTRWIASTFYVKVEQVFGSWDQNFPKWRLLEKVT